MKNPTLAHTCIDNDHVPCGACDAYLTPLLPKDVFDLQEFNTEAAWEAGKLTFAIIGAVGYAALLTTAHIVMAGMSISIFGACWYGIYRWMR